MKLRYPWVLASAALIAADVAAAETVERIVAKVNEAIQFAAPAKLDGQEP